MDRKRLVELSIEALENKKTEIDAEIKALRKELGNSGSTTRQFEFPMTRGVRRRRVRTAAERRAQSLRMREYWANRRSNGAKASAAPRKPAAGKVRVWTDAEKKALALRMREVWKKRKSEASKKTSK